jgi:hypothetical protein
MALTIPLDAWVALLAGSMEIAGNGYTREPVTFDYTDDGVTAANLETVQWAEAVGNWGTITAINVYDAPTGGTFLGSLVPVTPTTVNQYERIYIPAGGMQAVLGYVASKFGVGTFGTGRYATSFSGLQAVASTIGSPYNVGAYGAGPYERLSLGVLLLKTFAPVALCGGTSGQWTPHGPYEVA